MSTVPFISQVKSLWQAITGDTAGARKTQEAFLDAWKNHPGQQISDLADNIPIVGHVKGLVHLALGDNEAGVHSEEAATRTLAVIGAGALTAGTGGAAAPILAGVVAGIAADTAITCLDSIRHHKYEPQGYLAAVSEIGPDWRGGVFDVVALGMGDAIISVNGSVTKAKYKTTKVFRVEGEGIFLSDKGMVEHGANSRLFPGPGGTVIESPNILKLIVPPEQEEKPVRSRRPAALCLNVGDASRAEVYYAQKLLQYQDAVAKLRAEANVAGISRPSTSKFQFKIKSFRILTSDVEGMFRDFPPKGKPNPAGIRRVDPSKTSTSYECPQSAYTPLIEKVIPGTFKEVQPPWLAHMPKRLLEAMIAHQVDYGKVRTFVIVASTFTKSSLISSIAQKITDQELNRLAHRPVPLSILSDKGVGDIEVRMEPVRRLRQSREVKCGRTIAADVDHGRYMEYLAEFSDGSTSWIPSHDVALDLKQEFWKVVTSKAKEVAEIVKSDPSTGQVTVKLLDGTSKVIDQTKIFWQEEEIQTDLSDAELEALLYHGHFGNDVRDFTPCTATVKTDWAKIEAPNPGVIFMKDPAAEKAGEYKGVEFGQRTIQLGAKQSYKFVSKDIPFFIASNGSPFDVKVTHGVDASLYNDHRGSVALRFVDQQLVSATNPTNIDGNPTTFKIRPYIFRAGIFIVESDWGSITIDSKDTLIIADLLVDKSTYKNVVFNANNNSMKLTTGVFNKKFTIPFVIATRDETIDITIEHGRDKIRFQDNLGQATAIFGQNNQNSYTSSYNKADIAKNSKSFKGCKVNARPFPIPM